LDCLGWSTSGAGGDRTHDLTDYEIARILLPGPLPASTATAQLSLTSTINPGRRHFVPQTVPRRSRSAPTPAELTGVRTTHRHDSSTRKLHQVTTAVRIRLSGPGKLACSTTRRLTPPAGRCGTRDKPCRLTAAEHEELQKGRGASVRIEPQPPSAVVEGPPHHR
jgi:hypothetical protein